MKTILSFLFFSLVSFSLYADELSIYHGFASTHLFQDNSNLNNNNYATVVKYGNWFAGGMDNSFNNPGQVIGWQPQLWRNDKFYFDFGAGLSFGYEKGNFPIIFGDLEDDELDDKIIAPFYLASLGYETPLNGVSIQLNNMYSVVNIGIRYTF